jgi:hypothetical protein
MRILAAIPVLVLVGAGLGGCNTGAPQGVLPREPVPPPPSFNSEAPRRTAATQESSPSVQRRAISVPERLETPRPSSPVIAPVMTPSGAGAGFRF